MTVVIGEKYRPLLSRSLAAQGIETLWMPPNPLFDPRVDSHVDLSFAKREKVIIHSKGVNGEFVKILTNRGYELSPAEGEQGERYPQDVGLCALDTGRYLICNPQITDSAVMHLYSDRVPVPVSQGYARCAAAVVNEHSIITADAGVSKAARRAGLDVLDIECGSVQLAGFSYGFIGGACFAVNKETLCFTGRLDAHPDRKKILDFIKERGVRPIFLTNGPLIDIGGAITLP